VVNPDSWGLMEASGTGIVGSVVGGFIMMNFEGGGVCADGLVACGVADDEGVISRGYGDRCEIHSSGGEDWGSGRSE
jgi:hypothetical protein